MKNTFHKGTNFLILALSTLVLSFIPCYADTNVSPGYMCSPEADNSTTVSDSFKTNLNNLLDSLAANVLQSGFYKAAVGKNSNKIYGLIQCRGDVSPTNCANCTNESIKVALHNCTNSKSAAIWFSWCFMRYSSEKFFGTWEGGSVGIYNQTDFDDSTAVLKGIGFMTTLASVTPNQLLLFQTSVLDVGQSGQRFGMAQCGRDLRRSDCGKCLDGQLVSFGASIENLRGWEIYGLGCSMWYRDFQFYSNISTPYSAGGRRLWHGVVGVSMTILSTLTVQTVL
ncbi:Cysteine-rich repeat secretory protein [Actinidia chinensis var. chinensis]|uniref:Cysteine-rich repeat secretory protein n=1 Tax=Actinidia chinensis var. chinensis TaxID=1590841 RepID=A0A2R6QLR5_ACTCC|nr:Cysteine-rich repeat secretory protein [Actinidia chinensis var. chinensis]